MTGPIVIAAGGTGGHFFPAEALAASLIARGHRVVLMTDRRTGRRETGAFATCEQHIVDGAGIAGRSAARAAKGAMLLTRGIVQARRLMRQLQPSAVVGFGGYPCVPPLVAARAIGRDRPLLVLHEQNAVLGRANRVLSRLADILALGFDATTRVPAGVEAICVGNPVRPGVLAAGPYRGDGEEIHLAVFGGSLGASVLGAVVPDAVARLDADLRARLHVVQQCRADDLGSVRARYAQTGVRATLAPFFDDMAEIYGPASLVISRAGASSIAELTSLGRPAVVVPLPNAIDDHQNANAHALAEAGGGWVITQSRFTDESLSGRLGSLLRAPASLRQAAEAAASLGRPDSADEFAALIEQRLRTHHDAQPGRKLWRAPKNATRNGAANRRIGRHPKRESVHSRFESR